MKNLEVVIKKEQDYIDIFTYECVDGELDCSDYSQISVVSGITGAKKLIKEIYKGQRFSGGREIYVN